MIHDAKYWVDKLELLPHPEGGYYKQTYKSAESILGNGLPERFGATRSFCTGIYFLITEGNFSAFHKIKSDEMWHFYYGTGLVVHVIHEDGRLEQLKLGTNPEKGEVFQAVVPSGTWFASEVSGHKGYALVGCTVAPGFEFDDFEMAKRKDLTASFPVHESLIKRLTRT